MNGTRDNIGQLKVADSATASEDRGYAYDTAWNLNYRTNDAALNTFIVKGKIELTNAPSPFLTIDIANQEYVSYDADGRLVLLQAQGEQVTVKLAEEIPTHVEELEIALRRFLLAVEPPGRVVAAAPFRELVELGRNHGC